MRMGPRIIYMLSLIGSAIGIFYGIGYRSIGEMPEEEIVKVLTEFGLDTSDQVIGTIYRFAANGVYYALFNILEIIGVGMLMRGDKRGFHAYAASQIGAVGVMTIVAGGGATTYILWCGLWTYIYYKMMQSMTDER